MCPDRLERPPILRPPGDTRAGALSETLRVAVISVDTPHGRAKAHLHRADQPQGALILGHGAAGGVGSRDLVAVTNAALAEGVSVALVEQPYRVAGRRSPAPARQLDVAWKAVVEYLGDGDRGLPVVVGGRSLGARSLAALRRSPAPSGCCASHFRCSHRGVALQLRQRADYPSSKPCRSQCSSCKATETASAFRRQRRSAAWYWFRATTASGRTRTRWRLL